MTKKFIVTKEFRFEAAHSLPHLPPTHKCHKIHGHSYKIVIACGSNILDSRGFVIDYAEISEAVDPLIQSLDHQNINTILPFSTTAENLSKWFFDNLHECLPVIWVEVYETPRTCCRYSP